MVVKNEIGNEGIPRFLHLFISSGDRYREGMTILNLRLISSIIFYGSLIFLFGCGESGNDKSCDFEDEKLQPPAKRMLIAYVGEPNGFQSNALFTQLGNHLKKKGVNSVDVIQPMVELRGVDGENTQVLLNASAVASLAWPYVKANKVSGLADIARMLTWSSIGYRWPTFADVMAQVPLIFIAPLQALTNMVQATVSLKPPKPTIAALRFQITSTLAFLPNEQEKRDLLNKISPLVRTSLSSLDAQFWRLINQQLALRKMSQQDLIIFGDLAGADLVSSLNKNADTRMIIAVDTIFLENLLLDANHLSCNVLESFEKCSEKISSIEF